MSKKRYVFCPGFSDGYDTEIQLEDMHEVLEYAMVNYVEYFAILDAISLEYYCSIELH